MWRPVHSKSGACGSSACGVHCLWRPVHVETSACGVWCEVQCIWSPVHVVLPGILHAILLFALHLIKTRLMSGIFQLFTWVTYSFSWRIYHTHLRPETMCCLVLNLPPDLYISIINIQPLILNNYKYSAKFVLSYDVGMWVFVGEWLESKLQICWTHLFFLFCFLFENDLSSSVWPWTCCVTTMTLNSDPVASASCVLRWTPI